MRINKYIERNLSQVCTVQEGVQIGKISKQWGGILKEMFTDADTFIITFPVELDVKVKMLLIAAGILIVG